MTSATPTQRSLAECEKRGWAASVAEGWDRPFRGAQKKDLFGFADIVALDVPQKSFIAIQCTSDNGGNVAARVRKSAALCGPWLDAGGRVLIWGWGKRWLRNELGHRRQLWRVREIEIHAGNRESLCGDRAESGEE